MNIFHLIKTPITYQGEEYEVHISVNEFGSITLITLYKAHHKQLFKAKKKDAIYNVYKETIEEEMLEQGIPLNSPAKYIEATKIAFKLYEEDRRRKEESLRKKEEFKQLLERRANKLAAWDGVIQGADS